MIQLLLIEHCVRYYVINFMILFHLIFTTTSKVKNTRHPHFLNEGTELRDVKYLAQGHTANDRTVT